MNQATKKKTEVLKKVPETEDVVSVYLAKPKEERFKSYRPGQFASLRIKNNDSWSEAHPFTISCAPGDDYLRLTVKKAGDFTQALHDLETGQEVEISGPFGSFCQKIEYQDPIVMIAGGVGITPFLSVLRHFAEEGSNKSLTLFWCNQTRKNIFAEDELSSFISRLNLRIVHVLSREKNVPQERQADGRIAFEQGHIDREIIARHCDPTQSAIYLCGPPGMQDSVLEELQTLGINPDRVDRESFVYTRRAP